MKKVIKYKNPIPKDKMRVVGAALIFNDKNEVLAVKREDTDGKVTYVAPGGRPDDGETLRDCAIREAKEEVNLDIKINGIAGILEKEYETGVWTFILYRAYVINGKPENMEPEEAEDVTFITVDKLDHYEDILWIKDK